MLILGIETSCDDTGVAVVEASKQGSPAKTSGVNFNILSNIVSSQIKVHAKYGGVVPNLAAREHLKNIEPCLKQAFKESKIKPKEIDLITVTNGPGLIPCLLIGVNFAKTLAYVWKKPIIDVNHVEAHILISIFNSQFSPASPRRSRGRAIFKNLFPAIALIVSGGHTQLVLVKDFGKYKIIGETRDDAAGECFDKIAKLLKLGYPGGPEIAKQAAKYKIQDTKHKIQLPRPMIKQKNYDFSFSGLKTAVLYLTKKNLGLAKSQICAEAQQAIIDVLVEKTTRAAKEYKVKTVILAGGVAANEELRKQLAKKIRDTNCQIRTTNFLVPSKILCTDNAAMIAITGYLKHQSGKSKTTWKNIDADANLRIKNWN